MKKLLCVLAVITALTISLTSCTDENVQPKTNDSGASGMINGDGKN